jgi:hypothetical protein
MDRGEASEVIAHDFPEGSQPAVHLLYRPGHYDILYPWSSVYKYCLFLFVLQFIAANLRMPESEFQHLFELTFAFNLWLLCKCVTFNWLQCLIRNMVSVIVTRMVVSVFCSLNCTISCALICMLCTFKT